MANDILSNLRPAKRSRRKTKRIGRGQGSGHGGTATRGHKGAKSRSGHKFRLWFEGGQMPLARRVPKFGFTPRNREEPHIVNVRTLEKLLGEKRLSNPVTPESLYQAGVVGKKNVKIKILGMGELKSKIEVSAHAFSKSAIAKIEAAGGKATVVSSVEQRQSQ